MNKIIKYFFTLIFFVIAITACRDEDSMRTPDWNDNIGAVTKVTRNPDRTFFNLLNNLEEEYVEFTVDVDGFEVTEISSVELQLEFTENDRVFNPFKEEYEDSVYAPVVLKTVNTFPATVQISAAEIVQALGLSSVNDFEVGDSFNMTFPINTTDGRKLTVALNSELCNQPAQPSFGGCNVQWVVTCPSAIALGSYSAVTNAESTDNCPPSATLTNYAYDVEVSSNGAGQYEVSDVFGGAYIEWYGACYGYDFETAATLTDVCNELSLNFVDGFEAAVSVTGNYDPATGVITYTWTNEFGDTGTTVLTPK
jgi:hypothetical protein